MDMNETVETLNLNDLIEYSDQRQVRKKFIQTDIIVSEIVCYEPGQVTKMHVHPHQDEIFYCMEGEGRLPLPNRKIFPFSQAASCSSLQVFGTGRRQRMAPVWL